ncbi:DUF1707 SHOCT-like domain-containing protein [Tessaracoccus defluvii]|uniref:DUF1707 domain-containing protein n=1 Tax=Tessaracoccus defluvii TaxID=1285901 RepID=A0A7H0H6V4_9ACTN|nr:DUF1707 domain-containing protein [Tessaracoccus defluvii]QNP56270.1 DUF1707 domain-containing protein [Tessaracoccus defluvii]
MALPPSSKYLQRPGDPVDETERASITTRLNDAFGDGRITHDEYAAAMDTLYGAKVLGDLVPVMEKLPAAATNVPAIVGQSNLPAGEVGGSRSVAKLTYTMLAAGGALVVALVILLAILL